MRIHVCFRCSERSNTYVVASRPGTQSAPALRWTLTVQFEPA
jgi:hypothetical protein